MEKWGCKSPPLFDIFLIAGSVSPSENEEIIEKEFADCAGGLHDDDTADVPPVKRKGDHVVEEIEQSPFQKPEDHATDDKLPSLLQGASFGRTGVDVEAELQKGRKGNRHQRNRIQDVDTDSETFMPDDIDSEVEQAGDYEGDTELQALLQEIPGEE